MLTRTKEGNLFLKSLDVSLFFDELFYNCKTEEEAEWLYQELTDYMEGSMEDFVSEL